MHRANTGATAWLWAFPALVLAGLAAAPGTRAASFIWDGGHPARDDWSLNQNWNPNGAPPNDGSANLIFSGTIRLTPNANGAWNVNSITFDSFAGAFNVLGDAVTLQGSSVTFAIANDSAYAASIANALALGSAQTWTANTANLSLSGTIDLGANTLTLTGGSDIAANGAISGAGGLVKTGAGTLTLTGANTYAGGTTITSGTLQGTTTSLQGNITSNAALVFDQAFSGSFAGAISGTGSLTKQNSGTLTLTSANSYSGATVVDGGTLALGVANALAATTAVSVASGASLQLAAAAQTVGSIAGAGSIQLGSHTLTAGGSNASTEFSGTLAGTGGLVKTGTGTLTLTGANTYSGGTTIAAGVLQGSSASLQGDFANDGGIIFDQATNGTFSGVISGTGTFTKQNTGTLTLAGENTYAGSTTINGGTLLLGAANSLSDTNAVTIASGATLQLGAAAETIGSFAGGGSIELGTFTLAAGGTHASTTFSGGISGTGALVKTGSGTLVLSGINTYSGGTTVNGGTVAGTTSSLQGDILNHGSLVFDQAVDGTHTGVITGTGSLAKQNAGTLIVSGANTYSGGTTVSAGTLQGTTSSLQGSIVNEALVIFDQTATGIYAGVMSGSGALTKQNTGTVILSGANTYSGGTTVSGGTLQGTTTSLQGSITNHAAVVFDQASDGTYSGAMSGTGSLAKQNSGALTLTGANTYTGGTTLTAGTLLGTTLSLRGGIVNDAMVVFDQPIDGTYSGTMSGSGSLTKQNTGTLTLSGANTYSGGTNVSSGALRGTTSSLQGDITNNAAVVFDQTTSGTYGGVMSGSGSLAKLGSGTVTLSAANTYSGGTTVSAGTLALGANDAFSAASNITLQSTAILGLDGFSTQVGTLTYHTAIIDFGAANVANSFLFADGGVSTGTLTINNFNPATDIFAFQAGASGVDTSFLNGVYFYGLGAGVLGATQSIAGYAGSWTLIGANTAAFKTWTSGGSNSNWSTAGNWDDNLALTAGSSALRIAFGSGANFSPVMTDNTTVNALRFNSDAAAFAVGGQNGKTLTFDGVVPSIIQLSAQAQTMSMDVALNGTTIVETTGAGTLTLSGTASGTGGITKVGTNTLVLSGANTYSGATTITDGALVLHHGAALGSTTAGTTVRSGATLQLENSIAVGAEALTLDGTLRNASGTNSYAGAIAGTGEVTVDSGSLSLGGTAANTYTGATTVNSGTLELAKTGGVTALAGNLTIGNGTGSATTRLLSSNQIADTSAVTLNASGSPVFNLDGFSETIGSLASSNSGAAVQLGAGSLTTGGDNSSTAFAGVISGPGGTLTKTGAGSFTLSGANSYTGASTVSAGTLILQHGSALGTTAGGTSVSSGATLQLESTIAVGAEALALDGTLVNASGANSYAGAISGSGAIRVAGGSLSLAGSAANTYTGETAVNAGTLELNKAPGVTAVAGNLTIGSGTGTGTTRLLASNQIADTSAVTLNAAGTPVFDLGNFSETIGSLSSANSGASVQLGSGNLTAGGNNASTTFAGVISGNGGSLTKTGAGTMILTGANTYTGGTTVGGGTLQGTTTSLQGAITNNAGVVFNQATTGTYSGVMSGTGSLTKQNTGTVILAGANTYSGGTIVSEGVLQGSISSLQGAITNDAAVVFDQTTTGTYGGIMSGTGSLTKQNTGTVILTGANTYSGGTTVSGGTLQGDSTSLTGDITNHAAVVFEQSANGAYAGVMSGTGSLAKQSTGTLTLTGANTYTGGTTVSAGTLQGNTSSLQGNIVNHASIVFDQAANSTYSGSISGVGSLTKQSSGTLTLNGINTYTGATTVSGGKLALGLSDALSNATNLTLAADTTLSLNGAYSQSLATLSFTHATVDFGPAGTANHFLIGNVGTATGNLTISNWTSGSDIFGIATNSVSQAFLDTIYFTGINVGVGAVISSAAISVGSYGTFYTLTPIPTFTWNGGQNTGNAADLDNWSKNNNWFGGIAPGIAAIKSIVLAGTVQTTNDMDGAYQIKGLAFRSDAGAFTINSSTGDTLTVGGAGVLNESAKPQTLNVPIALSASQTWIADSGNLVITGATMLNSGNTLTIDGAFNTTINAAIGSGAGGLVKNGSGTLTLSGANTFSGGVAINAGVVSVGNDGHLGATSGGVAFGGGTLRTSAGITSARAISLNTGGGTFDSNGFSSILSGVISGSGGLTKAGSGTLALSGANTFTGGVTLNAGTIAIASDANLGGSAGNLTFGGGTLQTSAGITSSRSITLSAGGGTIDSNGFSSALSGVISGSGGFTKIGGGTLNLSGANTYTGGTTVNGGTLQGNTTSLQGNIVNAAVLAFDQATSGTYAGVISGSGSLTKQNSGILTLSGANTYTGATLVSGGTLTLGASGALSATTALTITSGATFDVNSVTQTIGSLAGAGSVSLGSGYLAVGADDTSTTFSGALAGTGVFAKIGTGTLTFDSSFSFDGELKLTGGTLALAGVNLTLGTLRISGNTVLDFGNSTASVLTATNVVIEDGAVLTINNWVDLQDFFYAAGTLFGLNTSTLATTPAVMDLRGAAPQNQIGFNGFSNASTVWQSYDLQITPAPEPSTYGAILIGGAIAFLGVRRWRRARTVVKS